MKLTFLYQIVNGSLFFLVCVTTSWAEQPAFLDSREWRIFSSQLIELPKQVVVVQAEKGVGAKITLWQENGDGWLAAAGPWPAVIGVHGMAQIGQKKEGDGKTPAGLFPILFAFGEAHQIATGLNYRVTSEQDIWVDDPQSNLYNQWSRLPTTARSFERMKRKDSLYKLGLAVGYNQNPVVPGAGSAIFIHVWRNAAKGTAGCAALAEEQVRELVKLLRREESPAALFLP